jgi:tetratricopeptide (TPR) repeat protein
VAQQTCVDATGNPVAPAAHLVSFVGTVVVGGRAPAGEAPDRPICAGDAVDVGPSSRALISLIGADTPLRLDENTTTRIEAPAEPGSGLVELVRGGLYFLSEVRRTLTVRTPYVNAGVEGTEVYLRVADAGTEMIVLEGRVAATPGRAGGVPFATTPVMTGQRLEAAAGAVPAVTALPDDGTPFGALRRVTVGALSWTLYYPDVLVGPEAVADPRIAEAARLLVAGQLEQAEAALAQVPDTKVAGGLAAALRTSIAVARGDAAAAEAASARAVELAPAAAAPRLARSYARQLALDLDGAAAAAEEAAKLAPQEALPQARLAELYLMRGERAKAVRAADAAAELGASPLTDIVRSFAALAVLRGPEAEAAFRQALARESQNPSALLGLGIARIKQGDLAAGTTQLQNAAAADPASSLLRSYLGRAYFSAREEQAAAKQYDIAKALDPSDPTPWFYNAIQLQLANQPVEALREFDRSIELNDRRAAFRSASLLDQDLAARGAALARVYRDLGFDQLGVTTAGASLAADPASPSAHRFLSDLYFGAPRLEAARASELLQSQLLQDPNPQPLQPSLPFTDLDVVADAGPRTAGFNEYTPLFIGNGVQLDAAGTLGNHSTAAGEVALGAMIGRTSFSAGTYHYQTDGFRRNFDIEHDVQNLFAQTMVGDTLNLQAEYRSRETHGGDRQLLFDPDLYNPSLRTDFNQKVYRIGARYAPNPGFDLLTSYIHADEHEKNDQDLGSSSFKQFVDVDAKTDQAEAQLQARLGPAKLIGGLSYARRDGDFQQSFLADGAESAFAPANVDVSGTEVYALGLWSPWRGLDLSARIGWTRADIDDETLADDPDMSGLTPGIGLAWQPEGTGTTLRAALSRTITVPYAGSQTIRPTQIAGFNQILDEFDGTRADQLNLAVDQKLTSDVTVGGTVTFRWLARELVQESGGTELGDARDNRAVAYAYWTPSERWAFAVEPSYEWFHAREDESSGSPYDIRTLTVPVTAAWFHPSGLYAFGATSLLWQEVELEPDGSSQQEDDWGVLVDVGVGYRLPRRYGTIGVRIDNLLDQDISFQDESVRTDTDLNPRFLPARTFLLTATLNF